jgi:hypothetical protein
MNGVGYYRCNLIRFSSAREHQKALPSAGPSPMRNLPRDRLRDRRHRSYPTTETIGKSRCKRMEARVYSRRGRASWSSTDTVRGLRRCSHRARRVLSRGAAKSRNARTLIGKKRSAAWTRLIGWAGGWKSSSKVVRVPASSTALTWKRMRS